MATLRRLTLVALMLESREGEDIGDMEGCPCSFRCLPVASGEPGSAFFPGKVSDPLLLT